MFEICNPMQAAKVLSVDMRLNVALLCKISVFAHGSRTEIGLIRPTDMLSILSQDPDLQEVAEDVEVKAIQMIDDAK